MRKNRSFQGGKPLGKNARRNPWGPVETRGDPRPIVWLFSQRPKVRSTLICRLCRAVSPAIHHMCSFFQHLLLVFRNYFLRCNPCPKKKTTEYFFREEKNKNVRKTRSFQEEKPPGKTPAGTRGDPCPTVWYESVETFLLGRIVCLLFCLRSLFFYSSLRSKKEKRK